MAPQQPEAQFSRWGTYAPRLRRAALSELSIESALESEFALYSDEQVGLFYAPFDYLEAGAKIAIVGVTPGPTQAFAAIRCALEGMQAGHDDRRIQAAVKHAASFKGMRRDLVKWFDAVGLAELLSAELQRAVLTGCARRGPHYVRRALPDIRALQRWLAKLERIRRQRARPSRSEGDDSQDPRPGTASAADAIIVPLGKASDAVEYLCKRGELDASRCVLGFPHPSPASARRHELFAARRRSLAQQVERLHHASRGPDLSAPRATTRMSGPHGGARADEQNRGVVERPTPAPRQPRRTLFDEYGVGDPLKQRTDY